ncbi:MAG: putative porin [Oceanococcaceae bacterium]
MKLTTIAASAAAIAVSGSALAYQFEGTGTYIDLDDANDSILAVEGVYFFAPIDDNGVPRAEADFLRRGSNVRAFYATADEADVDTLGIGGEAYIQDFYAAAALTRTETGPVESDDLSLEVGFLPMDGVRFTLGYTDLDLADANRISVNGKFVRPLAGDQAFNAEVTIGQTDFVEDIIDYGVLADYFVNSNLSFGLGYADTDADNSNETLTLRARMFFIPTLSAQIEYNSEDFNDSIELGVTGRF